MHRRTEDKTPTEKACYWKKSKLSRIGPTIKFMLAKELGAKVREKQLTLLSLGPFIHPGTADFTVDFVIAKLSPTYE